MEVLKGSVNVTADVKQVITSLNGVYKQYDNLVKKMQTPITSTVSIVGVKSLVDAVNALKGMRVASTVKTIEKLGVALNKLKLNPNDAVILNSYANSLKKIAAAGSGASGAMNLLKQYSQLPVLLQRQQQQLQKLQQLEKQRTQGAQKLTGIYGVMQNVLQNIAQAAYWSIVYGTIYKIRKVLADAVELTKELDYGVGKAMRTGLSQEEVAGAFNPSAMYEGTDTAIKPVIDKYRELISLQALIFTSKHTSTVKDYTDALYELTSANIKLSSALTFAETAAKVALAAEGDVVQTTRSLAGIYNIFGDSIKDASTEQEKFNQIANTVLYVWGKEQMELSDLNHALKYSANVARIMNMDYRVLVATIGHLNTNMLRGSTAGTGLRQTWNAMAKDMNKLKYTFGDINKFLGEGADAQRRYFDPSKPMDFVNIIGTLRDKLLATQKIQTDGTGQIKMSIEELGELLTTFQIRGGNVVASLILSYDEWKKKIEDVMGTQAEFIDDFVKLQEMGISQQMEIFFKDIKLLPAAFLAGADSGREIALSIADMNSQFEELIKKAYLYGKVFSQSWGSAKEFINAQIPMLETFFNESVFWLTQVYALLINIFNILQSISPVTGFIYSILKVIVQLLNTGLTGLSLMFQTANLGLQQLTTGVDMMLKGLQAVIFLWGDWNQVIKTGMVYSKDAQEQQIKNIEEYQKKVQDTIGNLKAILGAENGMPSLPGLSAEDQAFIDYTQEMEKMKMAMAETAEEYKTLDINSKTFADDLVEEIERVHQAANEYIGMGDSIGYAKTMGDGLAQIRKQIIESYGGKELTQHAKDMQGVISTTQTLNDITEEWQMSLENAMAMMGQSMEGKGGRTHSFLKGKYKQLEEEWEKMVEEFQNNAEGASMRMQNILNELFVDLDMPGLDGIAKDLFKLDVDQEKERQKIQDAISVIKDEISKLQNLPERNYGEELLLKDRLSKLEQAEKMYTALIADQSAEREGIVTASEKKLSDFLMTEEEKKRQNIIDTHMDLMAEYEGNADAQKQIKRHLTDALKEFDAEQAESEKEKQDKRVKGEMEAAEAILKIRKQLLDDLQEKAQLELDIEHQKQVNKLKQEAAAQMATAKTDEERQQIKDQLDMQLSMLDSTYDIKEATLEQSQAQERVNQLLEEQALLQKEIAMISSGKGEYKDLSSEEKADMIKTRQLRLSEIDTQLTAEQLKMEQATGNIAEAQINAIDKVSSESDQKLKQAGEKSLPGIITPGGFVPAGGSGGSNGMPAIPSQFIQSPIWNPESMNKTPESLMRSINQPQSFAPSAPSMGSGSSVGIMLNSLFNSLSSPTASKEQRGNLSTFTPAASLPTSMFPSFFAKGPAGNLNIRDLEPSQSQKRTEVNLIFNNMKSDLPLPQDVQDSVKNTVNVLGRYMRRRGGGF